MLCFACGGHLSSEGGRSTSSIDILPSSGCITDRISSCCVERKRERGLASSAHFCPTKQQAQQLFFSFHPQKWIEMDHHHHPVSQWLSFFPSSLGPPIYNLWIVLFFIQLQSV